MTPSGSKLEDQGSEAFAQLQALAVVGGKIARTDLWNLLDVNSGTTRGGQGYQEAARVPKDDWRRLSEEEFQRVVPMQIQRPYPTVGILAPQKHLLSISEEAFPLFHGDAYDGRPFEEGICAASYNFLLDAVRETASSMGQVLQEPRICINPPNLRTVTRDSGEGIGLHVDEWFRSRTGPRAERPGRLVLNLGRQARSFFFINIPVDKMRSYIEINRLPENLGGSEIGQCFMQSHPRYPVIRLTIAPGAAYIAPTENLVHDGSSAGNSNVDIAAHVLGFFSNT
jgi:hypothetical protein